MVDYEKLHSGHRESCVTVKYPEPDLCVVSMDPNTQDTDPASRAQRKADRAAVRALRRLKLEERARKKRKKAVKVSTPAPLPLPVSTPPESTVYPGELPDYWAGRRAAVRAHLEATRVPGFVPPFKRVWHIPGYWRKACVLFRTWYITKWCESDAAKRFRLMSGAVSRRLSHAQDTLPVNFRWVQLLCNYQDPEVGDSLVWNWAQQLTQVETSEQLQHALDHTPHLTGGLLKAVLLAALCDTTAKTLLKNSIAPCRVGLGTLPRNTKKASKAVRQQHEEDATYAGFSPTSQQAVPARLPRAPAARGGRTVVAKKRKRVGGGGHGHTGNGRAADHGRDSVGVRRKVHASGRDSGVGGDRKQSGPRPPGQL